MYPNNINNKLLKSIIAEEVKRELIVLSESLAARLRQSQEKADKIGRGKKWQKAYENFRDEFNDVLTSIQRADAIIGITFKITGTLEEKAVSPQEASAEETALYVYKGGNGVTSLTLYNPRIIRVLENFAKDRAAGARNADDYGTDDQVRDTYLKKLLRQAILGMVHFGSPMQKSNHAREIRASAAEKGFGPLMYDIAMSLGGEIMADRDSVSDPAKKVWNYYFKNRPGDIEKKPLDNAAEPQTPPESDDGIYHDDPPTLDNPLNWTYSLKSKVNVSGLIKNDKEFHRQVSELFHMEQSEIDDIFEEANHAFFYDKYHK